MAVPVCENVIRLSVYVLGRSLILELSIMKQSWITQTWKFRNCVILRLWIFGGVGRTVGWITKPDAETIAVYVRHNKV